MKIENKNIEQILFRYKERLLTPDETAQVEAALSQHPEWKRMADDYDPTLCITADTSSVYPNKERLRQLADPKKERRTMFPLWSKISAAVCILLLLSIGLQRLLNSSKEQQPTSQPLMADNNLETKQTIYDTVEIKQDRRYATNIVPEKTIDETEYNNPQDIYDATISEPVCTDQLITYIDEDDTMFNSKFLPFDIAMAADKPIINEPVLTDQLIIYVDANTDSITEEKNTRNYAFEDWVNNLRLSRIEFQTNLYNQFCKLIEK